MSKPESQQRNLDDGSHSSLEPLLRTYCESICSTDIITIEAVPMHGHHGRRGYREWHSAQCISSLISETWTFAS